MACSTDFSVTPELLPLPHDPPAGFEVNEKLYKTYKSWRLLVPGKTGIEAIFETVFFAVLIFSMTLVAIGYRWSVKSTAIGWFPLLWALKPAKPEDRDWKTFLTVEWQLKKPQLVAAWSTFCLTALAIKYLLWVVKYEAVTKAESLRAQVSGLLSALGIELHLAASSALREAAVNFLRPGEFPIWQIALFVNSLLGLYLWWKMRQWFVEYAHNVGPSEATIQRTIGVTFCARHLLTSYVIACDGFILLQMARNLPIPQIGWKVFPWI
jgi:hypothetical protein